jgi:tRNA nucleotidyltransferase (CCA-adding enzyme)
MRLIRYLNEAREQLKDWQSYIRRNKELQAGVEVLKKINKAGYKAYIVGGSVRDIILGNLKPHDIDIATNMPMEELGDMYKTYNIGKSKDFGIVTIKQGGYDFEVAQFRQDGTYADGRRPESVTITAKFKDDANRRDFTINAMGINANGEIIDFFNGKRDIKNKVLKTVGDPYKRFGEDYLRMMRLARFASKLDFEIDKDTKKAAQKLSKNITGLSPERIRDELMKSAAQSGDKFADYIKKLDDLKLLKFILPEIVNLKWYKENLHHHPETRGEGGTVYSHVMQALKKSNTKDPIKNLAILLHDIGKGVTLSHEKGLPRYLGHAKKSVELVNDIADRLKMSNKEKETLLFAVGNHMKFHNLLGMRSSKIYKLVSNNNWDVLVSVARADEYARGEIFKHAGEFEKIIDKAVKIKEKFGIKEVDKRLKIVDGNRVQKLLNLKPGPKIGKIIKSVTEYILDNDIDISDKEKIDNLIFKFGENI